MVWRINHPEDEQLVTVATFDSHAEFLLARSRLESAGIECYSRNEHTARITGHFTGVFGMHQIELQVRAADAEDAAGMLQSVPSAEEIERLEDE